ncbi:hypothetical protein EV702DRAFT_1192962 [Suillus placidus]|uniref:Uncharacterized protein n=1 Tax=Suillus placidus TaxID=48579 RepID=A0A9P7D6Q7_9AGAM|nr:hypothetical protein EV702DRAFT_1192962 [Suillus placidus]
MSFYNPQIPCYRSSDNSSPSLHHFQFFLSNYHPQLVLIFLPDNQSPMIAVLLFFSNSCIIALQNQVNQLQIELVQAKTAYLTLETAFQELACNVQLVNADPTIFIRATGSTSKSRTPSTNQLPPVNKQDYPDVKFWTRAEWEQWCAIPQGLIEKVKHSPVPYLEDDNGHPVTEDLLDAIRKTIRSLWFEFGTKGLLKANPGCTNSPDAATMNSHNATTNSPSATTNSSDANTNSPDATTISPAVTISLPTITAVVKLTGSSSTSNHQIKIDTDSVTSPDSLPDDSELIDPVIDPAPLDDRVQTQFSAISPDLEKENMSTVGTSVPAPLIRPPILLINPLAASIRRPLTKSDTMNTAMTPPSTIANVDGPSFASASTALLSLDDSSDTSVISSKKVVRMRLGPKKNGCNLCTFRWLKQVNTNGGPTKEFNTYYSQLDTERIKSYDTEAAHLEKDGLWTKNSDIANSAITMVLAVPVTAFVLPLDPLVSPVANHLLAFLIAVLCLLLCHCRVACLLSCFVIAPYCVF